MTPKQIAVLRRALGENAEAFGERFKRSGRTVEDWEQGRRIPDALAQEAMRSLAKRVARKASQKGEPPPSSEG